MGFTHVTFLFAFLPVCILVYLAAYRLTGKNLRVCNAVLICEGLVFFWWAAPSMLLFFLSASLLIYILGRAVYEISSENRRRDVMLFSLIMLVFLAVVYRYLPAVKVLDAEGQPAVLPLFSSIIVPLGISFFVLSGISYILDIYLKKSEPGTIADVFLYTLFFPKAACGPIVLWRDFRPQIRRRRINSLGVSEGLKRIIIGYAKKVILADTFAAQIALIDSKMVPGGTDRLSVWLLALLYFFMIYCDFSGYSDIAIGLCRIFGFEIGENFEYPYLSGSVTEFWRSWHISLGRWFREYVYIPLGGSKRGSITLNVFITFCIAGLWHGWKLNLLLWGVLNGAIVAAEKTMPEKHGKNSLPRILHVAAILVFMYFGWILFRAPDMTAASDFFYTMFAAPAADPVNFTWRFFLTKRIALYLILAALGAFGAFRAAGKKLRSMMGENAYEIIEKIMLLALFAVVIMYVIGSPYTPFVYMSF